MTEYQTMTEYQIERQVQYKFDNLDARLMNGKLSQAEYDLLAKKINAWADKEYRFRKRD